MKNERTARRTFLKRAATVAAAGYVYLGLTLYSPKSYAFTSAIFDEIVKYVGQYFGMDWINDMKDGYDRIVGIVKDIYGSFGNDDGEENTNAKEIVAISKSNDATNTIAETIFNIEVATETQPAAVDSCIFSANRSKLNSVQNASILAAEKASVQRAKYSPKAHDLVQEMAKNGRNASSMLTKPESVAKGSYDLLTANYADLVGSEINQESQPGAPWTNMANFLTDSGYPVVGHDASRRYNQDFLKYLLADTGVIPDSDYVLAQYEETEDVRLGKLIEDITFITQARSTVEAALGSVAAVRERSQDIFNIYANGEKEYVVEIAKNHAQDNGTELGSIYMMSIIDTFNADVERFAQSEQFIKDFIKADGLDGQQQDTKNKIIEDLAVGETPLLITAASITATQQKWQLDILEQNKTISKLVSIMGMLDQFLYEQSSGDDLFAGVSAESALLANSNKSVGVSS